MKIDAWVLPLFSYHVSNVFHFHLSIHSLFLFHLHSTLGASSIRTKLSYKPSMLPSTIHHPFPSLILTIIYLPSIHILTWHIPCTLSIQYAIYFHNPFIYLILTYYPYLASLSPCHVRPFSIHTPAYFHPSFICPWSWLSLSFHPLHIAHFLHTLHIIIPFSSPSSHIPYSFHFRTHARDHY